MFYAAALQMPPHKIFVKKPLTGKLKSIFPGIYFSEKFHYPRKSCATSALAGYLGGIGFPLEAFLCRYCLFYKVSFFKHFLN